MPVRLVSIMATIVTSVFISCAPVAGQQSCTQLVGSTHPIEPAPLNQDQAHIYWEVLNVTQHVAAEALESHRDANDLWVEVGADTDSIWVSLREDTTAMRYLAEVLASILAAQNLKLGNASGVVAASLYERWQLKPEPALRVLADPLQGPRAKTLAVRATAQRVNTPGFETASLSALCSLAANAAAIRSLTGKRDDPLLSRSLQVDDFALYMELQRVIALSGNPSSFLRKVESSLPAGNPVRETLIAFLRRLH